MATSGSYDYSITAAQLIQTIGEDIWVVESGETMSSEDQDLILRRLNYLIKQLQGTADMAQGIKVLSRQRVTLFLAKGQQTYTIGPASSDSRATTTYGRTTISAAEAAGQTVISITSNTDTTNYPGTTVTMTASDIVGIQLDDGTIQWTTISGTPASTMTIAVALTGAAAAGNYVYWFTSRAQRFVDWEFASLRDKNLTDSDIYIMREVAEYESIPSKTAQGDPWGILIEPLRINTRVTLTSQPQDVTKQLRLTVMYPSEDYDAVTNDIAAPQEWFAYLEWETAKRCAPAFNTPWTKTMEDNWMAASVIARELNPRNSTAFFNPGAE